MFQDVGCRVGLSWGDHVGGKVNTAGFVVELGQG